MASRNSLARIGTATGAALICLTAVMVAIAQPAAANGGVPANYILGWGSNAHGQLGDKQVSASPNDCCAFASVPGGFQGWTSVSTGRAHTVAIAEDGSVWAWGDGDGAGLGLPGAFQPTPAKVAVLDQSSTYTQVAAGGDLGDWYGGDFSLALRSDGTVWGWGSDAHGQLGNGQSTGDVGTKRSAHNAVQAQLPAGVSITAISAGQDHSLALTAAGTVYSWGDNALGQLGNGTGGNGSLSELSDTPVPVSGLSSVTAISAGGGFSLALKSDGTVWAWGADDVGEAGQSNLKGALTPKQVTNLSNIVAISASDGDYFGSSGHQHALALAADGTVWAWGANDYGELGNGTTGGYSATPARVQGLSGITAIAAGQNFSLAARGKKVWAWGRNDAGQLGGFGKPASPPQPAPVLAYSDWLKDVVAIDAGGPFAEIIADPYEWFPPQPTQVIYVGQGGSKKMVLRDLPASGADPLVGVRASAPFRCPQLEIIASGDPAGPVGGPLPKGSSLHELLRFVDHRVGSCYGTGRAHPRHDHADLRRRQNRVPIGAVHGDSRRLGLDRHGGTAESKDPPAVSRASRRDRWLSSVPMEAAARTAAGRTRPARSDRPISGDPTASAVTSKVTLRVTDQRIAKRVSPHTATVRLTLRVT